MLRTIPWGSCSSKLWHSETHSETCAFFSRTMQVWCLCLRKHLGKKWHRWQWCNWFQMRFSLRFFHARLQASAANRTISSTPIGGTYASVQTLPPFRLNWVCLLTLWTVGFLECFFPSAIRQEVYTWEMKNCTPLWREAHFEVKMYKTHQLRTTFGSCDVEKVHAVVARSTFPSQNVQNTRGSDHFWKLWCRKSARCCGAKHISKSKCTKHQGFGPLLEVAMSKKCTPLWCEAHFQVKSVKNWRSRTTFGGSDVEKVSKKCTPLWREAHLEVKSVKNWGFWAFFDVLMSKK